MTESSTRTTRQFMGIHPTVFRHPLDDKALKTLQGFKGLDFICKKVLEYGAERIMHIENVGNRVRVGPGQLPELYGMVHHACLTLDLPPVDLYVEMSPIPNAFTYGVTRPFVVITTGLMDLMTPEELVGVLGHELGHVLCRHVLYRIVARNISEITSILGQATLGVGRLISQGLVYALREWYRKSEYSADRAGLLVCQDPKIMVSIMMKLAGGSNRYTKHMNPEAFLEQAREYDDLDDSHLNRAYKFLQDIELTHPIPVLRAKEIDKWSRSRDYQSVLAGDYEKRPKGRPQCGYCKAKVPDSDSFCPSCGAPVSGADLPRRQPGSPAQNCPSCLAAVPPEFDDCPVCGESLG